MSILKWCGRHIVLVWVGVWLALSIALSSYTAGYLAVVGIPVVIIVNGIIKKIQKRA